MLLEKTYVDPELDVSWLLHWTFWKLTTEKIENAATQKNLNYVHVIKHFKPLTSKNFFNILSIYNENIIFKVTRTE